MPIHVRRSLPFIAMLVVALGSVVFSCATTEKSARTVSGKPFYVNTAADGDGRIRTIQVLSCIDRVILMDQRDRSRRTELKSASWRYDPATTELALLEGEPYKNTIIHVEGKPEAPARFVLREIAGDDELFVAVDGRIAIRGFDYSFDLARSVLVFREDFDPLTMEYKIMYRTSDGGLHSIGDWKPENDDKFAYLEAQYFAEMVTRDNRKAGMDYYLDPSVFESGKPHLVLRAPKPEEKAAMDASPMTVTKPRFSASDRAVSKEVGFDVRTPTGIDLGSGRGKLIGEGKMIEESAENGRLRRHALEFYALGGSVFDGTDNLELRLGDTPFSDNKAIDERLVIERKSLEEAGIAVLRECIWGTHVRSGEKPEVVDLAVYSWKDRGVYFQLTCDNTQSGNAEAAIAQIEEYRAKAR